ncbi:MAG: hypothetical protein NT062_33750, partial [Proteobacteria bacterium]|nr:hypothetical protein [Pseudomonadota bacterium]
MRTTSIWDRAWRLAAWAPDAARELVTAAREEADDPHDAERALEILARVFATTGAWELAADAFASAAAAWDRDDPARALALRAVATQLPLAPFADDASALAAELDVVTRAHAAAPLVRRTIVELRHA